MVLSVIIGLFPYFFVGTFIEAGNVRLTHYVTKFPYFFVGTFIEAWDVYDKAGDIVGFPYFFVGTFIEAQLRKNCGS